jgi:hypothetical protein
MKQLDKKVFKILLQAKNLTPMQCVILSSFRARRESVFVKTLSDWGDNFIMNPTAISRHFSDLHKMSLLVRENIVLDDGTLMIKISNFRG